MIEMTAVLRLQAVHGVSREYLEDATMLVEHVLEEHANSLTNGASATANFVDETIEIDVWLQGSSVSEVQQKLALIVTQLEQHCGFWVPAEDARSVPPMTFASTATQVASVPRALVSA